jgi:sRNA-binding regulator protein Hfq
LNANLVKIVRRPWASHAAGRAGPKGTMFATRSAQQSNRTRFSVIDGKWRSRMPFSNRPREVDANDGSRRLFRAPMTDFKRQGKSLRHGNGNGGVRPAPPESTNAESFYYLKQMNAKTPMVIVMTDGEVIRGWIEWYDKTCLKVNREGAPNLLIQKACIKYLYKVEEAVE